MSERELDIKIKATDTASPTVRRASNILKNQLAASLGLVEKNTIRTARSQEQLVQSIRTSNLSLRAKDKVLKSVNQEMSQYERINNKVSQQQNNLQLSTDAMSRGYSKAGSSLKTVRLVAGQSSDLFAELAKNQTRVATGSSALNKVINQAQAHNSVIDNTVSAYFSLAGALKKALSVFVLLSGKENAFKLINTYASIFGITLERLANNIESMAGPFKGLSVVMRILSQFLQSNNSAMVLFGLVSADTVNNAEELRKSILGTASSTLSLSGKLRIASQGLDIYSSALLRSDSIMSKMKGTMMGLASTILDISADGVDAFKGLASQALILGASFAAIAGIDLLFIPIDKAILSLTDSLIKAQFDADALYSSLQANFSKLTPLAQKLDNFFESSSSAIAAGIKGVGVAFHKTQQFAVNYMKALSGSSSVLEVFLGQQHKSVGAMATQRSTLQRFTGQMQYYFAVVSDNSVLAANTLKKEVGIKSVRAYDKLLFSARAAQDVLKQQNSIIMSTADSFSGRLLPALKEVGFAYVTFAKSSLGAIKAIGAGAVNVQKDNIITVGVMISDMGKLIRGADFGDLALATGKAIDGLFNDEMELQVMRATDAFIAHSGRAISSLASALSGTIMMPLSILRAAIPAIDANFIKFGKTMRKVNASMVESSWAWTELNEQFQILKEYGPALKLNFVEWGESLGDFVANVIGFKAVNVGRMFLVMGHRVVEFHKQLGLAALSFSNASLRAKHLQLAFRQLRKTIGTLQGGIFIMGGVVWHTVEAFANFKVNTIDLVDTLKEMYDFGVGDFHNLWINVHSDLKMVGIRMGIVNNSAGAATVTLKTKLGLAIDGVRLKLQALGNKIMLASAQFFQWSKNMVLSMTAPIAKIHEMSNTWGSFYGFFVTKSQQIGLSIKKTFLQIAIPALQAFRTGLLATRTAIKQLTLANVSILAKALDKDFRQIITTLIKSGQALFEAGKHTEVFHKGLSGTIARVGILGSGLAALGSRLFKSDSLMTQMAGVTLIALGAAFGGLTFFIHQAVGAAGRLISKIGDGLTEASNKQIKAFSKGQSAAFSFTSTIQAYASSTEEAQKITERWTKFVSKLSSSTGETTSSMQLLVAEAIGVKNSFHLTNIETENLISSSIDLAQRAHMPAIDTFNALLNAMNGNSAGLGRYNLHLNEHAIKTAKSTEGMDTNLKALSHSAKGQIRLKVLMEQSSKAQDFATKNSFTYGKALTNQENALKNFNAELGRGAEIINGKVIAGLASMTNGLVAMAKPVLPLVGFFQALGGRILQVSGFMISHGLTVGLLVTSYSALNKLLGGLHKNGFWNQDIPLFKKSLSAIFREQGAVNGQIRSLGDIGKVAFQIMTNNTKVAASQLLGFKKISDMTANGFKKKFVGMAQAMLGLQRTTRLTSSTMSKGLVRQIKRATAAMLGFNAASKLTMKGTLSKIGGLGKKSFSAMKKGAMSLVPILKAAGIALMTLGKAAWQLVANPIGATIAAVVVVVGLLYLAFKTLEEKTGMISAKWKELTGILSETSGVFSPLTDSMASAGLVLTKIYAGFFNIMIAGYTKVLSGMMSLFKLIGKASQMFSGTFLDALSMSKENVDKLDVAIVKLDKSAAKAAKEGIARLRTAFDGKAINEFQKSMEKIAFEKALSSFKALNSSASKTMKSLKEFGPSFKVADITKKAAEARIQLEKLAAASKNVEMKAVANTGSGGQELADARAQSEKIAEMQRLLAIKSGQEIRAARLAEVKFAMQVEKDATFTTEMEIAKIRKEALKEQETVYIAAQVKKHLAGRGLASEEFLTQSQMNEQAQVIANAKEMTLFKKNLDDKSAAAISSQQEQTLMLAQLKAESLKGGGAGAVDAGKNVELLQEEQKFAKIQALGLASEEAKRAHMSRLSSIELSALGQKNALLIEQENLKMAALGTSPEGIAAQIEAKKLQDEVELETLRAKLQNHHDLEVTMKQATMQKTVEMSMLKQDLEKKASDNKINQLMRSGQYERAEAERNRAQFEKDLAERGLAYAIFNNSRVQQAKATFTNMNDMGLVFGKKGFEVAKKLAIADAVVNTYKGASGAYTALSSIPIVGPALGAVAAAAAVVRGVAQVKKIKATKFSAQAHGGMDNVPQSLNNKSFILKAGERVVQPEANKDLTNFLKGGGGKGGHTVNVTVNGGADGTAIEGIKQAVMDALREASERGEPVINEAGITRG